MPNRIIKQSICESETIAALSDFEFRLWVTLIVLVDDAGRGDARPAIIKGRGFPLRTRTTEKDISDALHGLAGKGCIVLYEVDGRSYFYFPTWGKHQRLDRAKPKFPEPPNDTALGDGSPQSAAKRGLNTNPNTNTNPITPTGEGELGDDETEIDPLASFQGELREAVSNWLAYKKERRQSYKPTGLKSLLTQIRNSAKAYGDKAVAEVIEQSIANNYQGITFDKLKSKPRIVAPAPVPKSKPRQATTKDLVEYPPDSGNWMPYWEAEALKGGRA